MSRSGESCRRLPSVPLWRRLLPLLGGFIVYVVLGCLYSLGCLVPLLSSYLRYKGQPDMRHSALGWLFTAGGPAAPAGYASIAETEIARVGAAGASSLARAGMEGAGNLHASAGEGPLSFCSKAESAGARKTQEELQLLPTYKSGSSTAGLFSLWLVYVLLGLSVHLTGIFWEATAAALVHPDCTTDPEAAALAAASQQQQKQQQQLGTLEVTSMGNGLIAAANLLGRIMWGLLSDVCSAATAVVIAEVANPDDFSYLYTLAYTSKPASACLSSLLLTLLYPSVGLSGCTALAAISASLALLLCSYVPKGMYRGIAL
ncbi:uncharacterized protein LOC34623936 [Cyclospora cayetanensis]|uniref:Uncharacterized protein LOC34623936 n=1 Tax=Cyclospora cayetanensis TaxID=88456 RepID=A0A6P6S0M8_9EIME|nr:uncharacterized protein LOC34623936 [Cyclospora cayetanensis]